MLVTEVVWGRELSLRAAKAARSCGLHRAADAKRPALNSNEERTEVEPVFAASSILHRASGG